MCLCVLICFNSWIVMTTLVVNSRCYILCWFIFRKLFVFLCLFNGDKRLIYPTNSTHRSKTISALIHIQHVKLLLVPTIYLQCFENWTELDSSTGELDRNRFGSSSGLTGKNQKSKKKKIIIKKRKIQSGF